MKDSIKKIRQLLDELESNPTTEEPSFKQTFQLFELPELVASIVDYLQPVLQPYEAAIYWHIFRHSIIATGDVFARVSTRGLQDGVVKSMRAHSPERTLALATVRDSLTGLVTKGAISLAGDVNREGTPYRIHLPEEIALCREAMSRAQEQQLPRVDPRRELDFYNIKRIGLRSSNETNTFVTTAKSSSRDSARPLITSSQFLKAATILMTIW